MGQVKIYGLEDNFKKNKETISDVIHSCIVDAFDFPKDKRFHRFIKLSKEEFIFPDTRSELYTIIEISIFEGRSDSNKKKLITFLFERLEKIVGISKNDIEITIFETPKQNWGIRGIPADELILNYKVEV